MGSGVREETANTVGEISLAEEPSQGQAILSHHENKMKLARGPCDQ